METNYSYRSGDEVLVYWNRGQEPERARVAEADAQCLTLTLGDTGRVYDFDLDRSEQRGAKNSDAFRDRCGRLVRVTNRNKDRKNPKPAVDIG